MLLVSVVLASAERRSLAETAPRTAPKGLVGLPRAEWVVDSKGQRSDPVSIYIRGSLKEVRKVFKEAGWYEAYQPNFKNNMRYFIASTQVVAARWIGRVLRRELHPRQAEEIVQRMPLSVMKLDGRKAAVDFEKNNEPLGGRDHFRLYGTKQIDPEKRHVWAIAASRDLGIVVFPTNTLTLDDRVAAPDPTDKPTKIFLTHKTEKNIDPERDFIIKDLARVAPKAEVRKYTLDYGPPSHLGRHSGDGMAYDVALPIDKRSLVSRLRGLIGRALRLRPFT